jgi:DNA-binding transcriptional MocR family regulator
MAISKPPPATPTSGIDDPVTRMFTSVLARPDVMSFGAGFMNPAGFDAAGVRAAFAAALADEEAPNTLQYGLPAAAAGSAPRSWGGWRRSRFPPTPARSS